MLNTETARETYDKTMAHLAAQYADTGLPELVAKATTAWQTAKPYAAQAVTVALRLAIVLAYGALKLAEATLDKLEAPANEDGLAELMAIEEPWAEAKPVSFDVPYDGDTDAAEDFAQNAIDNAGVGDAVVCTLSDGAIRFSSLSIDALSNIASELGIEPDYFFKDEVV